MSRIHYAFRRLAREPWSAVVAIATLAIAIGACTALFSIVQAVLLRPMGIDAPARVVVMWPTSHGNVSEFPFAAARTLSDRMSSLHDVALVGSVNWFTRFKATSGVPGEVMSHAAVSASFFDVLRAPPLLGRTFRPADDLPTAPRVLILSHGLWVRRFGQDPNVIGRLAYLSDHPFEIVGVMRPEFFYPRGAEFWTPAGPVLADSAQSENVPLDNLLNGLGVFYGVARLADGATADRVRAETAPYLAHVSPEQKLDVSSAGISVTTLPDQIFASARPALLALMGAVVAVLLIACTNVAALLLARDASRTRETAVHAALGASRWTLVSQRIADSGVIAVSGAVIGVAAAALAIRPLVSLSPADIPRLDAAAIDLHVLGFAVGLTVMTTVVVGLLPAWRLGRVSVVTDLKGAATGTTERSGRVGMRRWLVALQVATTVVLLIAAVLSVRSFIRLAHLDLGFDPAQVLTFTLLGTDDTRVDTREQGDDLLERLLARLRQDPRVVAAGAVNQLPFAFGSIGWNANFLLEGQVDSLDTLFGNPPLNRRRRRGHGAVSGDPVTTARSLRAVPAGRPDR